jgi:hypothetical protein
MNHSGGLTGYSASDIQKTKKLENRMSNKTDLSRNWVVTGIVCGFLAGAVYGVAISVNLPMRISYPLFWSFGPLLMVSIIGLYHFMSLKRKTLSLQLGTLFVVAACVCVTLMGTIQGSARSTFASLKSKTADETLLLSWDFARESANATQLGIDLAWDLFLFAGIILLGMAMLKHPYFGKIIGSIGILLGAAGLFLNIYTYPTPPGEAGLIDVGPLTALWFLPVTILIFTHFKKAFKD